MATTINYGVCHNDGVLRKKKRIIMPTMKGTLNDENRSEQRN